MNHAVVNRLTLSKPFDSQLIEAIDSELIPALQAEEGFVGFHVVQLGELEVVLVVLFDSREALDQLSREVAAPWFAERVRPYLGGPVQREVGPLLYTMHS